MVGVAALRFAYVRHKRPEAAEDAAGNFQSHVFGIIFIVYRERRLPFCAVWPA